jgi:hypothetical protein
MKLTELASKFSNRLCDQTWTKHVTAEAAWLYHRLAKAQMETRR